MSLPAEQADMNIAVKFPHMHLPSHDTQLKTK